MKVVNRRSYVSYKRSFSVLYLYHNIEVKINVRYKLVVICSQKRLATGTVVLLYSAASCAVRDTYTWPAKEDKEKNCYYVCFCVAFVSNLGCYSLVA